MKEMRVCEQGRLEGARRGSYTQHMGAGSTYTRDMYVYSICATMYSFYPFNY